MADDIDKLLSDGAPTEGEDIDALLAAPSTPAASSRMRTPTAADLQQLDAWNRQAPQNATVEGLKQGAGDPLVGLGQVAQHAIPESWLNTGRTALKSMGAAIGLNLDDKPVSTSEFDQLVRNREATYQGVRKSAGKEGLDLARIGGNVANPVTWLGGGEAAGAIAAIRAGASQGAFQALMQPVDTPGSFLYNKGLQTALGAAGGGTLGGALYALRPAFAQARKALGGAFGKADEAAQTAGAAKVTEDTLNAAGVDPKKVDPNLFSAMQQEVKDALASGVDPDPQVMARRANAASLPVPIMMTRGQATRNPLLFGWEKSQGSKLQDVGIPLSERLTSQNRQLIENLNVLGAKNAPSTYDASQQLISHLQSVDQAAKGKIDQAYAAVRNSAGQPALMDREAFSAMAKQNLGFELSEHVPPNIMKQYNALADGQVPLTVQVMQTLDPVWSAAQRGASPQEALAIGKLRDALNNAPVNDDIGQQSMQAYKTARAMAKQRFDLLDASPAYKAAVDGAEPDKFFQKYVQGANVSDLASLKGLIGPDNTKMLQQTLLGNVKRRVLNNASDEDGNFSESTLNKLLQDDVQAPRLRELFADDPKTLDSLYRLGMAAEDIKRFPPEHNVNTSNTAVTVANILKDVAKSEGGSALLSLIPGANRIRQVASEAKSRAEARAAVNESLSPGVTKGGLKSVPPSRQVSKLGDLAARGAAAYAASYSEEKRP